MVESSKSGIPTINDGSPPTGVKMRTGTPDIVFSHYPFKKMWKFSMSEVLQGDTLSFLTHIYPSVEHWVRLFLA